MSKPKRNDIIVLETRSSSTDAKMKVTHYRHYALARAAKVNRQGIVEQYQKPDMGYAYTLDKGQRVLTIADAEKQAAARKLFETIKDNWFPTAEAVKDAILSQLEPTDGVWRAGV